MKSKLILLTSIIALTLVLTATNAFAKPDFVKTWNRDGVWGSVKCTVTLMDTNNDGCYDQWHIKFEWDLPWPIGKGSYEEGGKLLFKGSDGSGYENEDPNKDPNPNNSYIFDILFFPEDPNTPYPDVVNCQGWTIIIKDTNGANIGIFEKLPSDSIPLYSYIEPIPPIVSTVNLNDLFSDMQNSIVISPNPSSDFINIKLDLYRIDFVTSLKIFNLDGKIVYQRDNVSAKNEHVVDCKDFAPGVYFLKTEIYDLTISQMFIISR